MSRMLDVLQILKKNEIVHGLTPEKLRKILEELGPTFIKFGQILSMRPDVIPDEYCKELAKLRTNVDPMDFDVVQKEINQECGRPWNEVFKKIIKKPLGSASIGQVHKAVLLDGSTVVIKIQRPNIKQIMADDIRFCKKALGILKVVRKADEVVTLHMVLDEMWEAAQKEFDFLQEGMNLKRFYELNKDVAYATCPKVNMDLTTNRMLVMEYIDGTPVDDLDALEEKGYDLDDLGEKLAENYVKQVLKDAFFHADPHAGNISVRDKQIVWMDLGMMGELTERDRSLFSTAVEAIAFGDVYELKDVILAIGDIHGEVDQNALYSDLDMFVSRYAKMDFKSLKLQEISEDIKQILHRHNIRIGKGLTMLVRGVITIESVVKEISPKLDFLGVFTKYVKQESFSLKGLKDELKFKQLEAMHVMKKTVDLPGSIIDFMKMSVRGQTKLNVQISDSPEFVKNVNSLMNRAIIALIDAALLVASSLICLTDMKGQLFGIPALGVVGYVLAIILGIYLLVDAIRQK
ncbi:MAG: AarF/ABC1/UbiB kinase family protein [Lachnospiraceae bacterium]|nr:AarF/ABC1/UbiB kinase family protein [Lachnospiraceae bacterium]